MHVWLSLTKETDQVNQGVRRVLVRDKNMKARGTVSIFAPTPATLLH